MPCVRWVGCTQDTSMPSGAQMMRSCRSHLLLLRFIAILRSAYVRRRHTCHPAVRRPSSPSSLPGTAAKALTSRAMMGTMQTTPSSARQALDNLRWTNSYANRLSWMGTHVHRVYPKPSFRTYLPSNTWHYTGGTEETTREEKRREEKRREEKRREQQRRERRRREEE